jgi:RNA polymerase sigma-70 factor (ECF subfamily)
VTTSRTTPETPEARFGRIFEHLEAVANYAARRGSADPEGIAAETMAIAWRRLTSVPDREPRPWLFVTARNLIMAERRAAGRRAYLDPALVEAAVEPPLESGDPVVTSALMELAPADREALTLIAWDDLTTAAAAATLGISAVAFRVRLHRARRRFADAVADRRPADPPRTVELESP